MLRRATLFSDICAPSPPASVLCVVGQDLAVPELSRFFGIVISMHYNEHAPPHFHTRYGAQKATVRIRELTVLHGGLSPRVLGLVVEWAALHRDELVANWACAARRVPLVPIAPLE
jgi:Domain of unknown function (DUF4160)